MTPVVVLLEAHYLYGSLYGETGEPELTDLNDSGPGIILTRISGAFLCR